MDWMRAYFKADRELADRQRSATRAIIDALGPTSFPVVCCGWCMRIVSFMSDGLRCEHCARQQQVNGIISRGPSAWMGDHPQQAELDAWKNAARKARTRRSWPGAAPLWISLLAPLSRRARLIRTAKRYARWQAVILEPGVSGPVRSTPGHEALVAEAYELPDAQGRSVMLTHFVAARYAWTGRRWRRREPGVVLSGFTPTIVRSDLGGDQLADAFCDFQVVVDAQNRSDYAKALRVDRAQRKAVERDRARLAELRRESGGAEVCDVYARL
jgi:hypothetical protein